MDLRFVDAKKMKSLEDYVGALVTGLISIKTLLSFHEQAIHLGILKEDQECRANTLLWDFKRLSKLYLEQADSVLDLLPDTITFESILDKLKTQELAKAKQIARKPRTKRNKMRYIIYARVSTNVQDTDTQLQECLDYVNKH